MLEMLVEEVLVLYQEVIEFPIKVAVGKWSVYMLNAKQDKLFSYE